MSMNDYRSILEEYIRRNEGRRAYKSTLAEAASCQSSHISQILKGNANLTLDQAAALAQFWEMNRDESEYFVTLVNLERASSAELRKLLDQRLMEIRIGSIHKTAIKLVSSQMPKDLMFQYYSSWIPAAVHRALDIPRCQTPESLAAALGIPESSVVETLNLLVKAGLAEKQNDRYVNTNKEGMLLTENDHLQTLQFSALRHRAIVSLEHKSTVNVYMSGVFSLSEEKLVRFRRYVRDQLIQIIAEQGMAEVECDRLVAVNVDFFELI